MITMEEAGWGLFSDFLYYLCNFSVLLKSFQSNKFTLKKETKGKGRGENEDIHYHILDNFKKVGNNFWPPAGDCLNDSIHPHSGILYNY